MIVNGPIAPRLGISGGTACFGGNIKPNATIGRALRLVMRNLGGAKPDGMEKSTQAWPGKLTCCFAENEARSPWPPFHTARGHAAGTSAVTVVATRGLYGVTEGVQIKHVSPLRANHYPEQPTPPVPGQLRAGAHTDYGALTVLLPENVPGGLQVLNPLDEWVDVAAPAGAFGCNLGDLMQRWTNDRWRSTMHRVVNRPREHAAGNRRVSFAFFHQPNHDAVIECLPGCSGPGNPPRYPPVVSSQHRTRTYLAGLGATSS